MLKRYSRAKPLAVGVLLLIVPVAIGVLHGEPAADQKNSAPADSSEHKHIDPVEVNGPIFVGWPKPDVALVFSGEQNGYVEPCGCAGLENQKGGLKRRFTFLKQLRDKGWNVVPMDIGGQEARTGVQAELKVDFTLLRS